MFHNKILSYGSNRTELFDDLVLYFSNLPNEHSAMCMLCALDKLTFHNATEKKVTYYCYYYYDKKYTH